MFKFFNLLFFLSFVIYKAEAQQKDSMDIMLKFIKVGSSYRQPPLHLVMEYIASSNVITDPEDSVHLEAVFYLMPHGSYMHFGEVEEIVNDSMALLISDKIQRMMLYKNAQPMLAQMKSAIGVQVPDASVKEWCSKFEAYKGLEGDKEYIRLRGRSKIYGTSIPKEEMEIIYKEDIPVEITSIKRKLLPVDEAAYKSYKNQVGFSDKLIKIDNQHYVIKEQKMLFRYLKIDHSDTALPVFMDNRIKKVIDQEGFKYIPVKGFENYQLTEE